MIDQQDDNVVNKLSDVEKVLEEYEHKIFLDKIKIIEPRIDITREIMLSMHYEDLQGLAWELAQYSLCIAREYNKHQSRFNWAEANLKRYIEKEANNYSGWSWNERQANALNESTYANKLNQLKIRSKLAIDRLSYLPNKIELLSKIAQDIAYTKRRYSNVGQGSD